MILADITNQDFETKVLKASKPVIVDFWASWCGPCKLAGPILEALADEYKGKVEIYKINIDEHQENAQRYNVMSIPTTILFKDGKEISRQIGFAGKGSFEELIKQAF